jgi:hypothetical protein
MHSFRTDLAQFGHIQINLPIHHALVQEQWDAACGVFNVRPIILSLRNVAMSVPSLVHFRLLS